MPSMKTVVLGLATAAERTTISRLRHDVYARELGQHPVNVQSALSDPLDAFNEYIVARRGDAIAGFVSVTPPGHGAYAIDKYLTRAELPFACDERLYEVRLLTVLPEFRRRPIAGLLMYAALRWIEGRGGTRIVAIGRREVLKLYCKVGLQLLGREIQAGAVRFELMTATTRDLSDRFARETRHQRIVHRWVDWQLAAPLDGQIGVVAPCRTRVTATNDNGQWNQPS
ncbi:MAG TPA: GNAT family N-acetyltransferase [Pirellulales bacterium]|jgi:GNAT superfamily N-acetyltransferase|nr:GNAT family N-acetyltransferase [Pirellulales bacterium]